ncbi:response regulator transcription factor [Agathobaculum sp. LCP25S3_E8]|uniref:response regulator transcription factor n=1 Tax=Agathobaculum sp. LCP25S3_E8 TaxID=3438735 RepID=UPI003F911CAE
MKYTILIAEDDLDIIELLTLYLSSEFTVQSVMDGAEALERIRAGGISLALVDIMMPGLNGYELIQRVREFSNLPIIILSAKSMDTDKVLGLNIGADAYITKPFNAFEVVAYVKSALRRYYQLGADNVVAAAPRVLTVGELELDTDKFVLRKNGLTVPLTSTELKIIAEMMRCPGRVFTRAQLYECVGGTFYESDDSTMMVHISNLRAKIEHDPANPQYIKTVRGLGYKIEDQ